MRLPSMTTPEPVTSFGADLVHGLKGSGYRNVENTLTTAFSTLAGTAGAGSRAAVASEVTKRKPRSRRDVILRGILVRVELNRILSRPASSALSVLCFFVVWL